MKPWKCLFFCTLMIAQFIIIQPAESQASINCGDVISTDTTLDSDLYCPEGTGTAITINAANVTLDLGGHTISGDPDETGVMVNGPDGITIKNGNIDGFNDGIFLIESDNTVIEQLTITNLTVSDINHFVFGVHIFGCENVTIQNMQFEFLSVAHKEAVEVYESDVTVDNINVLGGGAGVSFSFAGICDPVNAPSNGTVTNSTFTNIAVAGIWISCTSDVLIEDNDFLTTSGGYGNLGIQGDAPFADAATGVIIRDNAFHDLDYGIEFRGIRGSTIMNNRITNNTNWGIMLRRSLGCIDPGYSSYWVCFISTADTITNNFVLGNGADLFQEDDVSGNTWSGNVCRIKVGNEIPECIAPSTLSLPIILK
jgi:parallel beta-helix repeat protein